MLNDYVKFNGFRAMYGISGFRLSDLLDDVSIHFEN